jgi:hypothetical protein
MRIAMKVNENLTQARVCKESPEQKTCDPRNKVDQRYPERANVSFQHGHGRHLKGNVEQQVQHSCVQEDWDDKAKPLILLFKLQTTDIC